MKKILFVVFLGFFVGVYGKNDVSETLFFSSIIFEPLFELAAKDEMLSANAGKPLSGKVNYSIKGEIYFSNLTDFPEDEPSYDYVFSLFFSLAPHFENNLYVKNKCIKKLVRLNHKDGQQDTFIRTGSLSVTHKDGLNDYQKFSRDLILDIYAAEDMFPSIKERLKNNNSLAFEIVHYYENKKNRKSSLAISFPSLGMVKHFSMRAGRIWNSSCHYFAPEQFMGFAVTVFRDLESGVGGYIGQANVMNINKDGFFSNFFPDGGVKDYVPMRSGQWGKQSVWNNQGTLLGTYDFPPEHTTPPPRITEYFPGIWLADMLLINGYRQKAASYWDEATKSPRYELVLSTPDSGLFPCQFNFSERLELADALYEEMLTRMKSGCADGTVFESPVSFKSEIGDKSFGISLDGAVKEVVFLRENLVLHLRSSDRGDVKLLASELDKAWNSWSSTRKNTAGREKGMHEEPADK